MNNIDQELNSIHNLGGVSLEIDYTLKSISTPLIKIKTAIVDFRGWGFIGQSEDLSFQWVLILYSQENLTVRVYDKNFKIVGQEDRKFCSSEVLTELKSLSQELEKKLMRRNVVKDIVAGEKAWEYVENLVLTYYKDEDWDELLFDRSNLSLVLDCNKTTETAKKELLDTLWSLGFNHFIVVFNDCEVMYSKEMS